jgi:hypothetical protein
MGVLSACTPRRDVLEGELDDAIFAADFGHVISGNAPKVYQDAKTFFQNTHPAKHLKKLVQMVFQRLAHPKEEGATVRLSTGFGGGKTHTLMALWHLSNHIQDFELGTELLPAAGRPSQVTAAAVDARQAGVPIFAIHGARQIKSLWGEIFHQLGKEKGLEILGPADNAEGSPSESQLEAVFPTGPVLILLDELVVYMAKLSDRGQGNLLGFLNSLAAVVKRRPQTMLLITDPAGQVAYAPEAAQLGDALNKAAAKLDDVLGRRVDTDFDPIGPEAPRVIARRLFEKVNPPAAQKTAALFHSLYQRVSQDHPGILPTFAATMDYARRLEECYPFHPRLMDTAQDRLGALQQFHKSRGVLRLFARILRDVWEANEDLELITAGDLNWSSPRIQADLLHRLNKDSFKAAISADVERHAGELDGGVPHGLHRRVASALLLESLPLHSNSGLDKPDLTLAVLRPEEAGPEPAEALDRLLGECWHTYPMPGGRGWQFRYEPNVIKLIGERMPNIPLEDAKSRVQAEVQGYFAGPGLKLAAWPSTPQQVPDAPQMQVALCESEAIAQAVCRYADDTNPEAPMPRRFRNGVAAITAKADAFQEAITRARKVLAAEEIELEHKTGEAYKLLREQLRSLMPSLKRDLRLKACQAFNTVVLADKSPYTLVEKYQVKEETALQKGQGLTQLLSFFQDKALSYQPTDSLDVDLFVTEIMAKAVPLADNPEVVTAKAVKERFWAAPGLKLLRDDAIVRQSILKALQDGKVLVQLPDGRVYDAQGYLQTVNGKRRRASGSLSTLALDEATLLTRPPSATGQEWVKVEPVSPIPGGPDVKVPTPKPPPPGEVTAYNWEDAVQYAGERPLLQLQLRTPNPAAANKLLALAQPLGAAGLSLEVSVEGPLKDGGAMRFLASEVKPTHPAKPLFTAQTIYNSIDAERVSYEATLSLSFGDGGRPAMQSLLQQAADKTPEEVSLEARFGKPGGGLS